MQAIIENIKSFKSSFWLLNLIQMVEKLAYWIMLLQIPVYIAQKDAVGGLQWGQDTKGQIFFFWAVLQNMTSVFSGAFIDRLGRKKAMFVSYLTMIIGLILIATQREFYPFLFGTIIYGMGLGVFRPALQGSVAANLSNKNSAVGWGIYIMLLNFAVFFGPPITMFLKEISWQAVFLGSAAIMSLNFILTLLYKPVIKSQSDYPGTKAILRNFKENILNPQISVFLLIMTGFTIIYMQFYETLPNFIFDWVNTANVAKDLHLPDFLLSETPLGTQISYEWLYNINSGLIVLFVVLTSWLFAKAKVITGLWVGVLLATVGFVLSGISQNGYYLIAGFWVYTFGEMIANPHFNEFMGSRAKLEDKSMFMSFMYASWTIGLGIGALSGGWIYKHLGEKSGFAIDYLEKNYGMNDVAHSSAFSTLIEKTGMNATEATSMLWEIYSPEALLIPFGIVGMMSVFGLIWYSRKYR